jgi:hypothetical protein
MASAHLHEQTPSPPPQQQRYLKYGAACVGIIPAAAWASGGYDTLQYLLFAVPCAVVGVIVLLIELFKQKLTYRSVWGGALLFPLYAMVVEIMGYPMRPAFLDVQAQRGRYAQQANTDAPRAAQPAEAAQAPEPPIPSSRDGLVLSFGNHKIPADAELVYNPAQDTISTQCHDTSDQLQINLTSAGKQPPAQSIALRLNQDQQYRTVKYGGKANIGEQVLRTFQAKISCESVEMLFITINDAIPVEVLVFRSKGKQ